MDEFTRYFDFPLTALALEAVSLASLRLLERGGQTREILVRKGFSSAVLLAYMRWALKDGFRCLDLPEFGE